MREREAFFKEACQTKDKEYQALIDEQVHGIEVNQNLRRELEAKIETLTTELQQAKTELVAAKTAIAQLKAELTEKDRKLSEISYQESVISQPSTETPEPEPETIDPEPTPETETENTESPAVNGEPSTVDPEQITQTEAQSTTNPLEQVKPGELLTASQLAKKVNEKLEKIRKENKEKGIDENQNLPKPLRDYSLRDWFKKESTCTDEHRAKKQEEYGFNFSHQDRKGTLWFLLP